jgi:hypothetical protein
VRDVEDLGEAAVGVKNDTVGIQSRGTVVDRFHENAIGVLGALQGNYFFPVSSFHHQGINAAATDGQDNFFGFGSVSRLFPDMPVSALQSARDALLSDIVPFFQYLTCLRLSRLNRPMGISEIMYVQNDNPALN